MPGWLSSIVLLGAASAASAASAAEGPALGVFRFVSSSLDPEAAPRELDDGRLDTLWRAGVGEAARGASATARSELPGARVRAVEIVGGKNAPKALTVRFGKGDERRVEGGPGARWLTLPAPLATDEVSVVVAEPGARENAIAEIAIYTDVDGPGGLERLAAAVAAQKAADGAAHLLRRQGERGARAVEAALPTAHGLGRRRLLQILAELRLPSSARALGTALETAPAEDRAPLASALAALGAAGAAEARRIYGDGSQPDEARADAATVLATFPEYAPGVAALVEGAGRGSPELRQATMRALAAVYATQPRPIEAALADARSDAAAGDLARAAGKSARHGDHTGAALIASWSRARPDAFALKLRLLRAMGDVADARFLAPLRQALGDEDPVLRTEAVRAAARVEGGGAMARAATADRDPGVRAAALAAVPGAAAAQRGLADAWPMVRRAALVALAATPSAPLPPIAAFLADAKQPLELRALAATILGQRKGPEAAAALARALDRSLGQPAQDFLTLACLRALGHSGDSSSRVTRILDLAAHDPMPEVRAAALEAAGRLCFRGAPSWLREGAQDPEPAVARAARTASRRCDK